MSGFCVDSGKLSGQPATNLNLGFTTFRARQRIQLLHREYSRGKLRVSICFRIGDHGLDSHVDGLRRRRR